jgi:hypothetical protein
MIGEVGNSLSYDFRIYEKSDDAEFAFHLLNNDDCMFNEHSTEGNWPDEGIASK